MTKRKVHTGDTPPEEQGLVVSTPRDAGPARLLEPSSGAELAIRATTLKSGAMGLGATTHDIQTTMRPDQTITVSDIEYQQLLTEGLVYSGSPVAPVADGYDLLFADKVQHGTATPAALRAASELPVAFSLTRDGSGRVQTVTENGVTTTVARDPQQRIATVTANGVTLTLTRVSGHISGGTV